MFYFRIQVSQPTLPDSLSGSQWAGNAILDMAQMKTGILWLGKTTVSLFTIKPAFSVTEVLIL